MAPVLHLPRLLLSFSLAPILLLVGCGAGPISQSTTGHLSLSGVVHGGQQAISGSVVKLYVTGTGGNGTAARDLISVPGTGALFTTTDNNGYFNITGDYTCPSLTSQVYIVSAGGNPGLTPAVNNPALVLVDALGSCSNLGGQGYKMFINEVTTAAAAWALAPFMTSATNVASSATNATGLANAMLNAQLLADPTTGIAPGTALPANATVETAKIFSLANALAGCVNSDGTAGCQPLFQAASVNGVAPTDTLGAALAIVKNPAANPAGVFNAISGQPVFAGGLQSAPNEWTMSMTVTGGGMAYQVYTNPVTYDAPTQLAIDTAGNVWTADYYGAVSAFSPQGTPLSPAAGFGRGTLSEVYGLAVDTNDNVWATNEENINHNNTLGSLSGLYGVTSGQTLGTLLTNPATNNAYFYDNSIDYPEGLASDASGHILIANNGYGSATIYDQNGSLVAGNLGLGAGGYPPDVSGDGAGGAWLANFGDYTATHVSASNQFLSITNCCYSANGVAVDTNGNAWISNYLGSNSSSTTGSISEVSGAASSDRSSASPVILMNQLVTAGLNYPQKVAIDAGQHVWVANFRGQSISELAGSGGTLAAGTAISPSANGNGNGGFGLDANLVLPYGIAPDASGNIWVANFGNSNVVMFFGLATPTSTPAVPGAPAP